MPCLQSHTATRTSFIRHAPSIARRPVLRLLVACNTHGGHGRQRRQAAAGGLGRARGGVRSGCGGEGWSLQSGAVVTAAAVGVPGRASVAGRGLRLLPGLCLLFAIGYAGKISLVMMDPAAHRGWRLEPPRDDLRSFWYRGIAGGLPAISGARRKPRSQQTWAAPRTTSIRPGPLLGLYAVRLVRSMS